MDNCSDYLQYLISIDAEKAIDHFFQIYRNIKKLKKFNLRLFLQSIISKIRNEQTENIDYRRYDNEKINPEKIDLYFCLISAIKGSKVEYSKISLQYYKEILIDYYDFFSEYERPKGTHSPDIYDRMHDFINSVWSHFESISDSIVF